MNSIFPLAVLLVQDALLLTLIRVVGTVTPMTNRSHSRPKGEPGGKVRNTTYLSSLIMASENNLAKRSARHSGQQIPSNSAIRRPVQSPYEELPEQHEDDRRVSVIPLGDDAADSRAPFAHLRSSVSSASEPNSISTPGDPYRKYSLSSYEHPYDIPPPERIHANTVTSANAIRPSTLRRNVEFEEIPTYGDNNKDDQTQKRQGILANMMQWYSMSNPGTHQIPSQDKPELTRRHPSTFSENDYGYSSAVNGMRRGDSTFSMMSFGSDVLDPDDPRVTGARATKLDDQEDLEKNVLRQMDYRARRKHIQRIRIEFNVSCKFCYLYRHIIL